MELLKGLVAALIMPLPIALALVALAGGAALAAWRRTAAVMLAAGVLVVPVASWGPVADALLAPLETRYPPVLDAAPHAQARAVVVLGSGLHPDAGLPVTSRLSDTGVVRLAEGVRLLRQLPDAVLVVCGGAADDRETIADAYAEAAVGWGVPRERIVQLGRAADTAQEAQAVRRHLGVEAAFLLVTSASHMPRSMAHFRRVGLAPVPAPTRHRAGIPGPARLEHWVPSAVHLRKTERALYEIMGRLAVGLDHQTRD